MSEHCCVLFINNCFSNSDAQQFLKDLFRDTEVKEKFCIDNFEKGHLFSRVTLTIYFHTDEEFLNNIFKSNPNLFRLIDVFSKSSSSSSLPVVNSYPVNAKKRHSENVFSHQNTRKCSSTDVIDNKKCNAINKEHQHRTVNENFFQCNRESFKEALLAGENGPSVDDCLTVGSFIAERVKRVTNELSQKQFITENDNLDQEQQKWNKYLDEQICEWSVPESSSYLSDTSVNEAEISCTKSLKCSDFSSNEITDKQDKLSRKNGLELCTTFVARKQDVKESAEKTIAISTLRNSITSNIIFEQGNAILNTDSQHQKTVAGTSKEVSKQRSDLVCNTARSRSFFTDARRQSGVRFLASEPSNEVVNNVKQLHTIESYQTKTQSQPPEILPLPTFRYPPPRIGTGYGQPPSEYISTDRGLITVCSSFNQGLLGLRTNKYESDSRSQKIKPSPPWNSRLMHIRGQFISGTGQLEKRLSKYKNGDVGLEDEVDVLKQEMSERKSRIEIFDLIMRRYSEVYNMDPLSKLDRSIKCEFALFSNCLPVYNIRAEIHKTLCSEQIRVLVIVAATGAGKSTQIPQFLVLDRIIDSKKVVLCTQPRKVLARSLAQRVANEYSDQTAVVYSESHGLSRKISPNNESGPKIVFITEKCFLDFIRKDPNLTNCGCVLLDEAHERTINGDMCLGMLKKTMKTRTDLKVIITSASVNPAPFLDFFADFGSHKIELSARQFPVEVIYDNDQIIGALDRKSSRIRFLRTLHKVIEICQVEAKKKPFCSTSRNELSERAGHVVAFLISPNETIVAKRELEARLEAVGHTVPVSVHCLYGSLDYDDVKKVLSPSSSNHHMVIFATNWLESSITLPGVRYVVDCGLVKFRRYDPVRNTGLLEVGMISKTMAIQRAGRVGRTAPGVCYRMYSEEQFNKMEDASLPDIMRLNLSEVVLYMIAAGIKDLERFDLISNPGSGALRHAQALLCSIKAVKMEPDGPSLTVLGKEIIKLPLNPHLSKMVLESRQYDVVAETAVVCACMHIGSVFCRESPSEFNIGNLMRLQFADVTGDPVTHLTVFVAYINAKKIGSVFAKDWCKKNRINRSHVRAVEKISSQICSAMESMSGGIQKFGVDKLDVARARYFIPLLYCNAFGSNLAMYSGAPERGYIDFNEDKYVQLYPTSALSLIGSYPRFIVYERGWTTTANFILNACVADENWLKTIDLSVINGKRQAEVCTLNVEYGNAVKQRILEIKQDMIDEIGPECLVLLDRCNSRNEVKVLVSQKNVGKVQDFIKDQAHMVLSEIRKKTREVAVMNADYVLHMAGSGLPIEIIMPGEFCSFFAGKEGIDMSIKSAYRKELYDHFSQFGEIKELICFHEHLQRVWKHCSLIRMNSKIAARRAFEDDRRNGQRYNVQPRLGKVFLGRATKHNRSIFSLYCRWWRCASRCMGCIKLKSRNYEQKYLLFTALSKYRAHFQPRIPAELSDVQFDDSDKHFRDHADQYKIYLQSVPMGMDNRELTTQLEPILKLIGMEYDEIYVLRERSYPKENEEELNKYARQISDYILNVSKKAKISIGNNLDGTYWLPFRVHVLPVQQDSDYQCLARVTFDNLSLGKRVGDALLREFANGKSLSLGIFRRHQVSFEQEYCHRIYIAERIFDVLKNDLKAMHLNLFELGILLSYKRLHGRTVEIEIKGSDYKEMSQSKVLIDELLAGQTIKCYGESDDKSKASTCKLLSWSGKQFLENLTKRYGIIVTTFPYKMEVKIQGSKDDVERAVRKVEAFLRERSNGRIRKMISLRSPDYREGTLRTVLAENEYNVACLEKRLGTNVHLDVDIKKHTITFDGQVNALDNLLAILRTASDGVVVPSSSINSVQGPSGCIICFCTVDSEYYYLESCGHCACKSCFVFQIKIAIESREFPIVCVTCQELFTWNDLEVLMLGDYTRDKADDSLKLRSLTDASLAYFIQQNSDLYKHCSTPDCRGLHPKTLKPSLADCTLCGKVQCTKCGRETHDSMECDEYEHLVKDVGASITKWINADTKNRKFCPNTKCGSAIEKLAGCNHVQCVQCKLHFCWICLFSANESKDIYVHMESEHGTLGGNYEDIVREMENDPAVRDFIQLQFEQLDIPGMINEMELGDIFPAGLDLNQVQQLWQFDLNEVQDELVGNEQLLQEHIDDIDHLDIDLVELDMDLEDSDIDM